MVAELKRKKGGIDPPYVVSVELLTEWGPSRLSCGIDLVRVYLL